MADKKSFWELKPYDVNVWPADHTTIAIVVASTEAKARNAAAEKGGKQWLDPLKAACSLINPDDYHEDTVVLDRKEFGSEVDSNGRLQYFVYLLLRDELPTGTVAHLVQKVEMSTGIEVFKFTAGSIGDYARQLASRVLYGDRGPDWYKEEAGMLVVQETGDE